MSNTDKTRMKPTAALGAKEPGMAEYIGSVKTKNKDTHETYLAFFGSIRVKANDIGLTKPFLQWNKADVQGLVPVLKETGSAAHYTQKLRSFFSFHERDDLVKAIPKLVMNPTTVGPDDILTKSEVNRMLDAALSMRDKALIVLLYETGGRVSEVLNLNVENVELRGDGAPWFRMWLGKVKVRGEEHYGYVTTSACVSILKEWIANYPADIEARPRPLIPSFSNASKTERLTPDAANACLQDAEARAGIGKNLHAHLFRHTRATHLLREGKPEVAVKKLLGWKKNTRMLARYEHLVAEDVEAAMGLSGGERETPVEIVAPTRQVPVMTQPAFQRSLSAVEKRVADLDRKMAELRKAKPEVRTMADLMEVSDLATKIAVADWDAKSPAEQQVAALEQERDEMRERMARMEAALTALLKEKEVAQ